MTTVFIVSPVRIHRRGFRSLLEDMDGIKIIGGCRGEDAARHVRDNRPDVVLLDVTAHADSTVIKSIRGSCPRVRIIAVGVDDDDQAILFWMEHGASHFVTDQAGEDELVSAITEVVSDEFHWPAWIAHLLLDRVQELATAEDASGSAPRLTRRQREIVGFLDEGCSIKEIAAKLSIEPSTVKNHVHRILQKAHVHSRFEALARLNTETGDHLSRTKT